MATHSPKGKSYSIHFELSTVYIVTFAVLLLALYFMEGSLVVQESKQNADARLDSWAQIGQQEVDASLSTVYNLAQQTAESAVVAIESGVATRDFFSGILRASVLRLPDLFAAAVTLEQNAIDSLDATAIERDGLQPTLHFDAQWFRGDYGALEQLNHHLSNGTSSFYFDESTEFWDRDYYQQLKAGEVPLYISEIYTQDHAVLGKVRMFSMAVPLWVKGTYYGLMVFDMSIDKLAKQIAGINGKTEGDASLIACNGEVVMHRDSAMMGKNITVLGGLTPELLARAVRGESIQYVAQTDAGKMKRRLDRYSLLKTGKAWVLMTQMPLSALYNAQYRLLVRIGGGLLVGVAIFTLVSLLIAHRFAKPLESLQRVLNRMRGSDLSSAAVVVARSREIVAVQQDVEALRESFSTIISELRVRARALAYGSEEFKEAARKILASSEEQSGRSGLVKHMVEELVASHQEVYENIVETDSMVVTTLEGLRRVVDSSKESADAMEGMKDRLAQVENIASQTSILALNAAVEAAWTGEHGRSFAVVAVEVRKLSEHTAAVVDGVKKMIVRGLEAAQASSGLAQKLLPSMEKSSELAKVSAEKSTHEKQQFATISDTVAAMVESVQRNVEASRTIQTQAESLAEQAAKQALRFKDFSCQE